MKITKKQARLHLLEYQKLLTPQRLNDKEGIMTYIRQVGSIQYDPLSIIDTNPNLVLQSRIKNYQSKDLTDLLYKNRLLIDDWDKNQCIYPIEDWPYFRRYREKGLRSHTKVDLSEHEIIQKVKTLVKEKGPISSKDLNYDEKINWFWGDTKISKVALESLYYWGEVVIHHKKGIRKYYDLTEKVLPEEIYQMKEPNQSLEDFIRWNVKRRIGSIGLLWNKASDAFLGIYFMKSKDRNRAFNQLLNNKEIIEIEVEGINTSFFIRKSDEWILDKVLSGISYRKEVSFIAPLDNLMWDRKLIKELFNFDYTWEVYKPKEERVYGYYVLPVLYGEQFIARFEPVFNKSTKTLQIVNWWFEKDVKPSQELYKKIDEAINRFAKYLNASNIQYICKIDGKYD
ncbi:YcaQ family DNA glycosylase [Mycoplasmatota bacterium]|nr:YcaQ family DNA glycosylase [Mycoplasmatota bacterium]